MDGDAGTVMYLLVSFVIGAAVVVLIGNWLIQYLDLKPLVR